MSEDQEEDYWQAPPEEGDDSLGPHNDMEGCSHCGHWQCGGCNV